MDKTSGAKGENTVHLGLDENTATVQRETKLVLTSGAVKNEIIVRQAGAKKKAE